MGPGGSTLQTLVTSIWVGIGKIDNCFVFTLVLKRTLSYLRFLKAGKKKKKGPFVFSCPRRRGVWRVVVAVPGWGVPLARPIVWRSPGLTGGPGSRQVPGGSWGGCPSSRACAGHSGLLGSSLDPDPTWHSAGSLWVTALCLRRLLSPGAADHGVTSDPEAEHRHFRDLRPRRSEA